MNSSYLKECKIEKLKRKPTKGRKLSKLINNSDSDIEGESERELSYYIGDRVKLMKEVLKIIRPKKIKSMAPECMKNVALDELNSMLLEELLGISNKRLKYIFEGKNLDEESSSSDDDQAIDVISLDDVSDDDFVIISDEEDIQDKKYKRKKSKEDTKAVSKKIKKEKPDKERIKDKSKRKDKGHDHSNQKEPMCEENLMSVLELLELQARARAIRSQLELESRKKKGEQERLEREKAGYEKHRKEDDVDDDDDEVIMEIPKKEEIVITSSDSENDENTTKQDLLNQEKNVEDNMVQSTEKYSQQNDVNDKTVNIVNNEEEMKEKNETKKTVTEDESASGESYSKGDSSDNVEAKALKEKRSTKFRKSKVEVKNPNNDQNLADNSCETPDDSGSENFVTAETATDKIETTSHFEEVAVETPSESNRNSQSSKKIDVVVAEFVKSHTPSEESNQEKVEDEESSRERAKEKRLRHLKNKLQSYKNDVADGNVNILENIVIKQKGSTHSQGEENDDLVINVDQDDLDCIICD